MSHYSCISSPIYDTDIFQSVAAVAREFRISIYSWISMVPVINNEPIIAHVGYLHNISIILLFFLPYYKSSQKNVAPLTMNEWNFLNKYQCCKHKILPNGKFRLIYSSNGLVKNKVNSLEYRTKNPNDFHHKSFKTKTYIDEIASITINITNFICYLLPYYPLNN